MGVLICIICVFLLRANFVMLNYLLLLLFVRLYYTWISVSATNLVVFCRASTGCWIIHFVDDTCLLRNASNSFSVKGKSCVDSYTDTTRHSGFYNWSFKKSPNLNENLLLSNLCPRLHLQILYYRWSREQFNRTCWWRYAMFAGLTEPFCVLVHI